MRPKKYQLSYLKDICGKDINCKKEIIQSFILHVTEDLRQLEFYDQQKNWQQLGFWAHKLKSSVKIFSDELGKEAEIIEHLAKIERPENLSSLINKFTNETRELISALKKEI